MNNITHTKVEEPKKKKSQAEAMVETVEKILGNSFSRGILKLSTRRCKKCGRRIELSLKEYTGEKQDLCIRCRLGSYLTKKALDFVINKLGLESEKDEMIKNLKDPMWRKGLASVLEGIAEYGPKKPFTSYAPFLIVWNFTKACNLRCIHCYEAAEKPSPDELTTKEAFDAVDKMADAGVAYVALSGGEPLVRPDFFEVAERIREREMAFSIATNGTLLTKEIVKKLEKLKCLYVQISLDGAKPETHNSFRGANAFERTVKGIKNAVKSKMTVGVATTVTKHNYNEVPEIINLAEKLGADLFMHYNFIPTGRGKEIINLDISPKEREELLKMLAEETKKRENFLLLSTAPQYGRVCTEYSLVSLTHFDTFGQQYPSDNISFLAEFIGGCGTGRLYMALEPNGDLEPCVFIPIKIGNIKTDDLLDVWHNSPVLNKIRDRNNFSGNCSVCKNKNICGGCRARAYAYFGDLSAPDPGCIYNQKEWDKLKHEVMKISA